MEESTTDRRRRLACVRPGRLLFHLRHDQERFEQRIRVERQTVNPLLHQSVRVKEIMVYPVVTIPQDTSVAAAADMIIRQGIGCLPVLEGTRLVGMVTKTGSLALPQ